MRSELTVAAALVAGCLAQPAAAAVLTYCAAGPVEGFDPARYVTAATFDGSAQTIYDRLVTFTPGGGIEPALAESWDISDSGRTYTFHLRDGVKFQTTPYFTPKRDFNAYDVVFSLDRQGNRKNAYFGYGGGVWPYYDGLGLGDLIKSVTRVNNSTVKIVLTRADAGFLADLAMDFASILSNEYADQLQKAGTPELLDTEPVGTGPFMFTQSYPAAITYDANPDYWGGKPKLTRLAFLTVPDPAERLAKLKAGTCQVAAEFDATSLKTAEADADIVIAKTERLDLAYLAFNTTQKPFDDKRVRWALDAAIDKDALVKGLYGDTATVANTIMPHSMWTYDGHVPGDFHDVDYAKQLLAEAGVTNLKLNLMATRAPRPYSPDLATMGALISRDFAAVGVTATLSVPARLSDYFRMSSAKDRDGAVLIGWTSDNGDPDNFLSLLLSCDAVGASNRAQWCDEDFSKLLDKARSTTDPAERATLYAEAQADPA